MRAPAPFDPRPFALLLAALPLAPARAQQPATPGQPEACVQIEVDAERLACYDRALGRGADMPQAADAAARQAREVKQAVAGYERLERQALPPNERARQAVSDLFASEPDTSLDARIANAGRGSLLDRRWELARDSKLGVFNFRAYKPVYLLPAFWSSSPNEQPRSSLATLQVTPQELQDVEAKFQLSFKTKAVENLFGDSGDIWMGYTQSSRWQVYDGDNSRPFRETNYEPEVMLVFRTGYAVAGWNGRLLGLGVNHQSNGRADPLSRSWNRVMGMVGFDREDWALVVRPWWRISDGDEDENPGIENSIGRGDATLVHRIGRHELALMARHSLRGGERSRGALQFDWGFPISRALRGHLQVFDGYGESLIDYDHRATHVGLGVSLLEWY